MQKTNPLEITHTEWFFLRILASATLERLAKASHVHVKNLNERYFTSVKYKRKEKFWTAKIQDSATHVGTTYVDIIVGFLVETTRLYY